MAVILLTLICGPSHSRMHYSIYKTSYVQLHLYPTQEQHQDFLVGETTNHATSATSQL